MRRSDLQKWMAFGKPDERLPRSYHAGTKPASKFVTWLKQEPYRTADKERWLVSEADWKLIAESVGRAYRDHQGAMETNPGSPPPSPDPVWGLYSASVLGADQFAALDNAVVRMTKILATYI